MNYILLNAPYTISDGLTHFLLGFGTVFVVLISLVVFISLIKFISNKDKNEPKKETTVAAPVVEEKEEDDTELIAVIAAAISQATGRSINSFVVRSIKRGKRV